MKISGRLGVPVAIAAMLGLTGQGAAQTPIVTDNAGNVVQNLQGAATGGGPGLPADTTALSVTDASSTTVLTTPSTEPSMIDPKFTQNGVYFPVYAPPPTPAPALPSGFATVSYAQGAADIAGGTQNPWFVVPDGSIYVVGATQAGVINSKIAAPFKGTRVAVYNNGQGMIVPFVVATDKSIWRYQNSQWNASGSGIDVGTGGAGALWCLKTDGTLARWNWSSSAWDPFTGGGGGQRIAVDQNGNPWVTNASNQIWKWDGKQWQLLPGAAQDVSIGTDGTPYVVGMGQCPGGYQIYRWDTSTSNWSYEPGVCGVSVSAGAGLHAMVSRDWGYTMPTIVR